MASPSLVWPPPDPPERVELRPGRPAGPAQRLVDLEVPRQVRVGRGRVDHEAAQADR